MIKQLGKHDRLLSPFIAARQWVLSNVDPQEVVLTELTGSEEPVALEFPDYTNGPPFVNRECNIALEQQASDLAIPEAGKKSSGTFFPNREETNQKTHTFKRLIYDQIQKAFYNDYRNPLQIFGIDNIDFPLSKTDRFLGNEFLMFTIPRNVFGERLTEKTIQLFDTTFDDNLVIVDDGEGNLVAGLNLFSKVQEIRAFGNNIFTGSLICDSPIWNEVSESWDVEDQIWNGCSLPNPVICSPFGPPLDPSDLVVVSGSAILSWNDNSGNEDGFVIERSLNGITYTQYVTKSVDSTTHVDENVTQSFTYYYRVFAFNNIGVSGYSNTASITFSTGSPAGPSPVAWWKMEEAGNADRIDAISGTVLQDISSPMTPAGISQGTGKVGFSTKFSMNGFGAAVLATLASDAGPFDVNSGFHFVFWAAFDGWDANAMFFMVNATIDPAGNALLQAAWSSSNNTIFIAKDSTIPSPADFSVPFTPTPGQFYFFNIFWDASDQKYGIQVNNGAISKSAATSSITDVSEGTFLIPTLIWINGPSSQSVVRLDEYGFYGTHLKTNQLDFIYNSGSGRTWPFTLPA